MGPWSRPGMEFMSTRMFGGEKNHLPVTFSPLCVEVVKSAEKGCGICANAAEATSSNTHIASFRPVIFFIPDSPWEVRVSIMPYTIKNLRIKQGLPSGTERLPLQVFL